MELSFSKAGSKWVAQATVSADFNIHVETKHGGGELILSVGTVSGGGKAVAYRTSAGRVYDEDFDGIVYPKEIEIAVTDEPVSGTVTEAQ